MGHRTKLQLIQRKTSQQWYINLPAAVADIMDFQKGEMVEWKLVDRTRLILDRPDAPPAPAVKKKQKE